VKSPRVVSLLPSATEIVCALGAEAELVGISHECDFPPSLRGRTVLTTSRLGAGRTSGDIDRAVRSLVADALSIYAIDEVALARLAPDLIITQDLCEVCAVSLDDVRAAVSRLAARADVRVLSLHPTRLAHVLDDVLRVGEALGRVEVARAVRAGLEERIEAIRARAAAASARPRVASIEWLEPLMLGGTWMPELIELAGGVPVGARAGELAPTLAPEALTALEPDVVLIKPCGFTLARTLDERELIARLRPHLSPTARVYVADGNAFFNRSGPRLVESLEIMAACVTPEEFPDFARRHAESVALAW
jgi:iron complex transport system substrate-binding protein